MLHASAAALDNHLVQLVEVRRGCLVEMVDMRQEERMPIDLVARKRTVEALAAVHQKELVRAVLQERKWSTVVGIRRWLAAAFVV